MTWGYFSRKFLRNCSVNAFKRLFQIAYTSIPLVSKSANGSLVSMAAVTYGTVTSLTLMGTGKYRLRIQNRNDIRIGINSQVLELLERLVKYPICIQVRTQCAPMNR